jgi:hypothetical protein
MLIVAVMCGGEGGFLPLPVAVAFDNEFESGGLETVDG